MVYQYNKDKAIADEMYKDKRFGILGKVINTSTSSYGRPVIEFESKDTDSTVCCEFPKNADADIEAIKKVISLQ